MDDPLSPFDPAQWRVWIRLNWPGLPSPLDVARLPSCGAGAKAFAVVGVEVAMARSAQTYRLVQHRFEYRREVARRGIDDLQYLGGRGLLLQGLARLGQEPRIFHRDHRLRREILQ